jgi:hypothetical protein
MPHHNKTMKLDYEIEEASPKFRGKIYRDGHLFATGGATVSKNNVTFYPEHPKSLAIALGAKIKLKVKKNRQLLLLKLSQELVEGSSEKIWFFEY